MKQLLWRLKHWQLFRKQKRYVYDNFHNCWGNSIVFVAWPKMSVCGWKSREPKVGDLFRCRMKSDITALFIFQYVKYYEDPSDMFFADLLPVAEENEPLAKKLLKQAVKES
jgi:hypothetical protein